MSATTNPIVANPNGNVTATTDPITGRVEVSANDNDQKNEASRAAANGRIILPRSYGDKLDSGSKVTNIATDTLTITAATERVTTQLCNGTAALRLLSGANVDIKALTTVTPLTRFSIGFWAYKPTHQARSSVAIYMSNHAGYTNYGKTNVVIEPGLNYYAIPLTNFIMSGTGFAPGDTITQIRFRDLADIGDYPVMAAGSNILIGDIYIAAKQKAVWVWGFDDCKTNLFNATGGGTEVVGGDGVSKAHSFASFIESYGWQGTAYVIGGLLGAAGYCNSTELRALQDAGWTIGSHSWSHPNSGDIGAGTMYGLRNLGPAGYALLGAGPYTFTAAYTGALMTARNDSQAIRDDVEQAMATCEAAGLVGYQHFCTPQSVTDFFVQEALRACGIKSLRGARNATFADNKYALASGAIPAGWGANNSLLTALDNMPSSVLLDNGGTSDADVEAYIDRVIEYGAVGVSQLHDWNIAGCRTSVKNCADYIREKEAAGLIEVMTAEELYQYQRDNFRFI